MTNWTEFREEFEITKSVAYLNHAGVGPLPRATVQTWSHIVNSQIFGDMNIELNKILDGYYDVRLSIAQLIGCSVDEICLTMATSHGISLVLSSLDWTTGGKYGIIINDQEYTSNSFPYQQISKKYKLPLFVISARKKGPIFYLDLEDFEKILENSPIRLVAVSHVQFINGFRIDIDALAKLTHKYGAQLLIDGIQAIGALKVDVRHSNVDYLVAGGAKWCLGPFASGFLYVKEKLLPELEPFIVGALSDESPLHFQHHEFHPKTSALKFQGAYLPQNLGLGQSIALLNKYGALKIQDRIFSLTEYLIEQFQTKIPQATLESLRGEHSSGIVRFKFPANIDLQSLVKTLKEKYHVVTAIRAEGMRISPHAYNTEEEIDQLVTSIKDIIS
jgi:selenocysteine lyase/cysteine desulfurase